MNIIVTDAGTEHLVCDVSRDDKIEDGLYYTFSNCGMQVTGKLVRTKTKPEVKPCRRCFR
jgi:hypothetical protein